MAKRKHGNWLKAYLDYTQHSESPDSFHFWTGVSVLAGALKRQVWIDQGYFQWTPNFYIILVAPPGIVSKSTTAGIGMKLLRQIPSVHFGPEAVTTAALIQAMANCTQEVPMPNGDYMPMSCLTIHSSEFGTFLNPNDREMIDVLTSLWDGQLGSWEKATKTQGHDTIQNPWVNVIAATTPSWITGNFPEYMIGGGFTSRCVLVYADKKRRLVAYPGDEIPANFQEQQKELVHDLEIISELKGAYTLSKAARAYGVQWYEEHYNAKHEHLATGTLDGYLARKQTHIHKLAIVLAASVRDELVIEEEELRASAEIISALEHDMHKVFSTVGKTPDAQHGQDLVQIVHKYKRIPYNNLFKLLFRKMTLQQFQSAMLSAQAAGLVKIIVEGKQSFVLAIEEDGSSG